MRPQPPPPMSGAVVALWADEALRNTRAVVHALEHLGLRVLLVSLPPSFVGGQLQLSAFAPPEGIVALIGLGVDADAAFLRVAATLTTLESVVLCLPPHPPRSAVGRLRTLALVGESLAIESNEGELRIETSHWTVDDLVRASAEEISREMRRVAQWICNPADEEVAFREMGGLPPPEALQDPASGVPIKGLSQADSGRSFMAAPSRVSAEEEGARARAEELQETADNQKAAKAREKAEKAARASAVEERRARARAGEERRARERAEEESARASAAEERRARARAGEERRARERAEEESARARAAEERRESARAAAQRREGARPEAELREQEAASAREAAVATPVSSCSEDLSTSFSSSCSMQSASLPSPSAAPQPPLVAQLSSSSSVSCRDPSPQSPAPPCSSQSFSSSPSSALTVSIGASPSSASSRRKEVQSQRKIKRAPSSASQFHFAVTGPKGTVYLLPRRMFILQVWAMLEQSFGKFKQNLQLFETRDEQLVGRMSNSTLDPSERTLRVSVLVHGCTVDPPEETLTLDDDSALKSTYHEVSVPEEYPQDFLCCVVEIQSVSSSRSIFSSSFTLGAIKREPSSAHSSAVTFVHPPSEAIVRQPSAMQPSASDIAELLIFVSTTASEPLHHLSQEACRVGIACCWSNKFNSLFGGRLEDLTSQFEQRPVRRFLFSGHTTVMHGMNTLTFTGPGGVLSLARGTDFVNLLGQHSEGKLNEKGDVGALRLVFLNCCEGEQLARAICEAGVACVVYWRGKVLDQAALHFACEFFAVDARLSVARSQSDAHGAFSFEDAHKAFRKACKFVESQRFRRALMVLKEPVPEPPLANSHKLEESFRAGVPLMLLKAPNGEVIEIHWKDRRASSPEHLELPLFYQHHDVQAGSS